MGKNDPPKVGATGQFPFGKADSEDEGELSMALAVDARHGIIRIVFGKPVAWLGLPAAHARQLGEALIEKAAELERKMS